MRSVLNRPALSRDHSLVCYSRPVTIDPMLLVPTAHMESPVTQVDRDTLRHALEDSAFCQPKAANSDAVQHI